MASVNTLIAGCAKSARNYRVSAVAVPDRNLVMIRSILLLRALKEMFGISVDLKTCVPEIVWRGNEECVKGYLRALFQSDGTVNVSGNSGTCSVRLASSVPSLLKDVQMLLANFGILTRIYKRRVACQRMLPDGKGAKRAYDCKADYELVIDGESRDHFMAEIGFLTEEKNSKYSQWAAGKAALKVAGLHLPDQRKSHTRGREAVFDTTQADRNSVIFNGLVTGQCGEQPLPPYGSCLLGSVNLTRFVRHPFTDYAEFDWEEYREVVRVFTRMLDNRSRSTDSRSRSSARKSCASVAMGMGFLGLGSTITCLGMKYGSAESVKFTEDISREMSNT